MFGPIEIRVFMMLEDIKQSFLNLASLFFSLRYMYLYEQVKNMFMKIIPQCKLQV